MAVAACGGGTSATNAAEASGEADAASSASASPPQTAPVDWVGEYARNGVTAKIKRTARAHEYDVEILDANGGGGFGKGTVKGAVLIAAIPNGNTADGWKDCLVTFRQTPTGASVSGGANCKDVIGSDFTLNGDYTRAGKSVSPISGPSGRWMLPEGQAVKIGIADAENSSEFALFFLNCEAGPLALTALTNLSRKPATPRLSVTVDGRAFAVPAVAQENIIDGGWSLTATLSPSHPLLAALPSCRSLSMTVQGRTTALPVRGLSSNWAAFKRECRLP